MSRSYYVYMLTSRSRTLYVGVTNDLARRMAEHRSAPPGSFTRRYRVQYLVHFESCSDVRSAIAREKQLKGWSRERKLQLIEQSNPFWLDLAADWGQPMVR